ncbi:DNA repair protein [Emergomyces pasteurianus Ep9510]|uniref:DNA repair protein RAD14 n=1 Tax=Emergomyces pasteurianus Ep9510 TaxID=1447872 RepID=A0A1J9QDT2_9EURO|nr:DNA repair protein [Emergomyces pasteurianus Ep9510]
MEFPHTPASPPQDKSTISNSQKPLTPEQRRKIDVNRMKAKALREQYEVEVQSGSAVAGQKRPYSAISSLKPPSSSRDARTNKLNGRPLDEIRPARNFTKYVEYDLSKMTDTKGGFLTTEDDPHNKILNSGDRDQKPPHMTMREWEQHQLLQSLRRDRAGPFEPGLSVLNQKEQKSCRECGSVEIDWKWDEILKCAVCNSCKEKFPDKYSLLTKTEAKEDYLLTDSELKDEELLPHLEKPNPHKATWNNMMLYLRFQVEEYAFSPKKWGSPEGLDAEFERREDTKKKQRESKFKSKLHELKKRTRVEAYRRSRQAAGGEGAGGYFGDNHGASKHVHQWGRLVDNPETGIGVKTCVDCGMQIEELEF